MQAMSSTPASPPVSSPANPAAQESAKPSNFLRQIIDKDLAEGTYGSRHWGGSPGDAAHHAAGPLDTAKVRLRFPPEPNGYLHVGHAKSICLNFGLARDYGGVCHLRFDDTNPEKEDTEYVNSIIDAVKWLGFDWAQLGQAAGSAAPYQASDYFDFMYRAAEHLVETGHAYVDEQTAEQIRLSRGDFGKPGVDSPFRARTPAENLARLREMRDGLHEDGSMVLRAKIDMAHPNINLRDPAIYRIRRATHHHTGDTWCIYPMYTFAHPIEDALEQITHSICTLEFEDQRPFYDWLMDRLCECGLLAAPAPKQYEFSRLNLTYVITSKRKLAQLVNEGKVNGWDDPRMPTIVGLRRRGYTPTSLRLFADRIGVTKSDSWIDYSTLEGCLREDLENKAHRGMAVLDPVKLVLTNWAEAFGSDGHTEACTQDAAGNITEVQATVIPDTKSGTPGSATVKASAAITWVGVNDGLQAEVRMYDRLFTDAQPDAGGKDFLAALNPDSLKVVTAYVEPSLAHVPAGAHFQFERHGYFVTDRVDHAGGKLVFNKITGLKDSWAK